MTRRAALIGCEIELTTRLCEGAFEALMSGDPARHDEKVSSVLKDLSHTVDVILLAQASMARVVETRSESDRKIPILASPRTAMEHLARLDCFTLNP